MKAIPPRWSQLFASSCSLLLLLGSSCSESPPKQQADGDGPSVEDAPRGDRDAQGPRLDAAADVSIDGGGDVGVDTSLDIAPRDSGRDTSRDAPGPVDVGIRPDQALDSAAPATDKLLWPIDCVPGVSCSSALGYPDVDGDGKAYDCSAPGYKGHEGTDIGITWQQMDLGVDVFAAAEGDVLWVFDGKYDRCPNANEPDCQPPGGNVGAGADDGYVVCTPLGNFCGTGACCCYWCFAGGNVVVIRHATTPGVFATRYDHLKKGSIIVSPGQHVQAGQKIAQAGSAGSSSGPHLHFEVWGAGYYDPVEPWAGSCGPNTTSPLWAYDPPWSSR